MRGTTLALIVCVAVGFGGGCATLTRGGHQVVKFETNPTPADVVVNGKKYVSPIEVKLKRNKLHDVTVTKAGYQGVTFKFRGKWDAGGAGAATLDAVLPGGSVLFVIDTLVGADRQFSKMATITLPPLPAGPTTQPIVTLYEFKGKLMEKAEYDAAVKADKLFAKDKKKKKGKAATTQAAGTPG